MISRRGTNVCNYFDRGPWPKLNNRVTIAENDVFDEKGNERLAWLRYPHVKRANFMRLHSRARIRALFFRVYGISQKFVAFFRVVVLRHDSREREREAKVFLARQLLTSEGSLPHPPHIFPLFHKPSKKIAKRLDRNRPRRPRSFTPHRFLAALSAR